MWEGLASLARLDLDHNFIADIQPAAFSYLTKCLWIHLSHNKLTIIRKDTWKGLDSLQRLDLGHNFITDILPGGFSNLNLLEMYLNNNLLTNIQREIWEGMDNLRLLHLTQNHLTVVKADTFVLLSGLQWLYLENNRIVQIEPKSFPRSLSILCLSGNNLGTLSELVLDPSWLNLQLTLGRNPLFCNTSLSWMKSKEHNKIFWGSRGCDDHHIEPDCANFPGVAWKNVKLQSFPGEHCH